jgi:hypothetical protein
MDTHLYDGAMSLLHFSLRIKSNNDITFTGYNYATHRLLIVLDCKSLRLS